MALKPPFETKSENANKSKGENSWGKMGLKVNVSCGSKIESKKYLVW